MLRHLIVFLAVAIVAAGGGFASEATAATGVKELRIGYMTSVPVTIGSWDPTIYQAMLPRQTKFGWKTDLAEAVPPAQAQQVLTRFGSTGADIVFVTSQSFEKTMLKAAAKFPNTKFIMLADLASTNGLPNVAAYAVDWWEFGYLGGAAAGLVSKSGKIGLISGQPITPNRKAFAAAKAGARHFRSDAETFVQFTNDWIDPAKGREAAEALIGRSADVTFSIGGGMVPGIMEAASVNNTHAIGAYTDESRFAPKNVPSNIMIKWVVAFDDLIRQLETGKFEPEIKSLNIKNGGLRVMDFSGVPNAQASTNSMNELIRQIESGEIVVPHAILKR
jgi:basic membrane lipoprotein Med (substrate-binding protein (PBP1-ABC) superfamily)